MKTISKTIQTNMSKYNYFLMAFLVAFSFSCSPEDGNDGAVGPAGPAGANGQDGNANVISSGWVEYDESNWSALTSEFGIEYRYYPLSVSTITQDIVDDGMVLVYNRFVISNTPASMLPYSGNITGGEQQLSFEINPNTLTIKMKNVSGSGDPDTFGGPGVAEYRYIIVPSNNTGKMKNTDFSKMTYEEVMSHFGLEE
ncbi:hypothetical protein ACFPH8_14155 [Bizionia hallyeonensis]|uniref:Collagen triple helix repeat-containing protein n=1 Tax=Bizionia hallyeonensis TaxID=1123757 RepID=A0ABW0CB73_9FLAO